MTKSSNFFSAGKSSSIVLFAILVAGAIAVATASFANATTFKLDTAADIVRPLTGLLVAALFMERLQEVLVKAWRQRERLKIEAELKKAKLMVAVNDSESTLDKQAEVEARLLDYQNDTKNFAFAIGLAIGFVFALFGLRCLSEVMNYENIVGAQAIVFEFADLIVTAGVIAGGSDALHKFVSIFTDFFDATRLRVKQSAESG